MSEVDRVNLVHNPRGHAVGVQPSTGKPVFIRPELKDGPLARAAAAAAAQRPAVPGGVPSAQPQDMYRAAQAPQLSTSAQQSGAVQRLRQQYEGTTLQEPANLTELVCTLGCNLYCMHGACHSAEMAQQRVTPNARLRGILYRAALSPRTVVPEMICRGAQASQGEQRRSPPAEQAPEADASSPEPAKVPSQPL